MAKSQAQRSTSCSAIQPSRSRVPGQHVVCRGETLWSIAADRLHSPLRWPEIAQLNRLAQPYRIFVGQMLKLPAEAASSSATVVVKVGPGPLMKPAFGPIKIDRDALKPAIDFPMPSVVVDLVNLDFAPVPLGPTMTAKLKLEGKIEMSDNRIKHPITLGKNGIETELKSGAQSMLLQLFGSIKLQDAPGGMVLDLGLDSESQVNKRTTVGARIGLPRPDPVSGGWISDFSMSTELIFGTIGHYEFKGEWGWTCEVHQKSNQNGDGLVPVLNPIRKPDPTWSPALKVLVALGLLTVRMAESAAQIATGCLIITLDGGMSGAEDPNGRKFY